MGIVRSVFTEEETLVHREWLWLSPPVSRLVMNWTIPKYLKWERERENVTRTGDKMTLYRFCAACLSSTTQSQTSSLPI